MNEEQPITLAKYPIPDQDDSEALAEILEQLRELEDRHDLLVDIAVQAARLMTAEEPKTEELKGLSDALKAFYS